MNKHVNSAAWVVAILLAGGLAVQSLAIDTEMGITPPAEKTTKAILDLQKRVDDLERWKKGAQRLREDVQATVEGLEDSNNSLKKRIDQLDRIDLRQINRDLDQANDEIKDLKIRVHKLE